MALSVVQLFVVVFVLFYLRKLTRFNGSFPVFFVGLDDAAI